MTLSPVGMLNPSHQLQAVWKVTPNITAARSRLPQRRASSRDQKLIASRRTAGAQRLHPAMRPGRAAPARAVKSIGMGHLTTRRGRMRKGRGFATGDTGHEGTWKERGMKKISAFEQQTLAMQQVLSFLVTAIIRGQFNELRPVEVEQVIASLRREFSTVLLPETARTDEASLRAVSERHALAQDMLRQMLDFARPQKGAGS